MYTKNTFSIPLLLLVILIFLFLPGCEQSYDIRTSEGKPAELIIRQVGDQAIRVTLSPLTLEGNIPSHPALSDGVVEEPIKVIRELKGQQVIETQTLKITVAPDPLTVTVSGIEDELIQRLTFREAGKIEFLLDDLPVLGLGEGGPPHHQDWRENNVEFDRRGRYFKMLPRWQRQLYGSRNPVPLLVGTGGWGLFVVSPWVEVDLSSPKTGTLIPWEVPKAHAETSKHDSLFMGRPPLESYVPGLFDAIVFDARKPEHFMKDLSKLTGQAVMPPKWALGYMQSHRTLENDKQMVQIVDTFREKQIPVDAVIYLGTGFIPRGWNTQQPSLEFNNEVFTRAPEEVMANLHQRNVKVVVHVVPWNRERLPELHGSIPPANEESLGDGHILNYWKHHVPLIDAGIDAFWPDEGDWFNLFERMKRHQMYYQGPLFTQPNIRPWSLHRNGYLGVAKWGGWVWSGDPDSSWKTLRAQIAVGINHSLSLSPFWGSDIGGFFPNEELTGDLYARWFQFGAFCPSFRAHGQTWWTRLPWGWGLDEMGPRESASNPLEASLNDQRIEPICRQYAELRYQLLPYNYTLAWEARTKGFPMIRSMWLHYPNDEHAAGIGDQYLWGRDLLIAPVYERNATERNLYLPEGTWFDWWTGEKHTGGQSVTRQVDLATLPIYVRAGAIIPMDPVRQYVSQPVTDPTVIRVYTGSDGTYTLYEDDGKSLEYLDGACVLTTFSWNSEKRELTISSEGKMETFDPRPLIIRLVNEGISQEIVYSGKKTVVSF